MSDKTFKTKSGDEIIITVARRKKPENTSAPARRKGIIETRRPDDYLPRRLQNGGINFYDLGQILLNGLWRTRPFAVAPEVEGTALNEPNIRNQRQSDYDARDSYLLGDDLTNLSGARRLARAHGEYFGIVVAGENFEQSLAMDNPRWTNGGLTLSEAELAATDFSIRSRTDAGMLARAVLTGIHKNKITASPNFSAEIASFAPGRNDSYYFMPPLVRSSGRLRSAPAAGSYQLGLTYCLTPRFPDEPLKAVHAVVGDVYADYQSAFAVMIQSPQVRVYDITSPPSVPISPANILPAAANLDTAYSFIVYSGLGGFGSHYVVGQLAMIIRQNNALYYVWHD